MTTSLDDEIVAAATVIATLLVFVFAYFAALLPLIEGLRSQSAPDVDADKRQLRSKVRSYQFITAGLGLLMLSVLALLIPLSARAVADGFFNPFDTLRASLLLVDLFLVVTFVVLMLEFRLLGHKHADLS